MRKTLFALSLVLALSAAACGRNDSSGGSGSSQGPAPGSSGSFIVAQDSTICSEAGQRVYYQPAVPGGAATCYCAIRVGRDTGANPETSNLIVYRPAGSTYVVTGIQKGSGAGKWNDTWADASCPN